MEASSYVHVDVEHLVLVPWKGLHLTDLCRLRQFRNSVRYSTGEYSGTLLVLVFSDPMVDVLAQIGTTAQCMRANHTSMGVSSMNTYR